MKYEKSENQANWWLMTLSIAKKAPRERRLRKGLFNLMSRLRAFIRAQQEDIFSARAGSHHHPF